MEIGHDLMERREIPRRESRQGRQVYYWIKAVVDGRLFVDGPYFSEDAAFQAGYRLVDVNFECIPLHTKDSSEATRQLKHKYLEETQDIRESVRYAHHGKKENL